MSLLLSPGGAELAGGIPSLGKTLFVDNAARELRDSQEVPVHLIFNTIQGALDACNGGRGDRIMVMPGAYDEAVVNAFAQSHITIIGLGGRGAAYIDPSTEDAIGFDNRANDITIVNLGIAAEDDTAGNYAMRNYGSRLRMYDCKLEGGDFQLGIGPGTVAQEAAGTHGRGADCLFSGCEFCWGANGVRIVASDYGAVTQARFEKCRFHNLTASAFEETGGTASIRFRNLQIIECDFDDPEGGTAPTKYISLNDDNGNDGIVAGCTFPTAINSGLNLVSTALHWVSNRHTGGISTGQPS